MSDPFLSNQDSYSQKEIFRLRSENKQLRVELSKLRVLLEHLPSDQLSNTTYGNQSLSSKQCRLSSEQSENNSVPSGTQKNNNLEKLDTTERLSVKQTEEELSSPVNKGKVFSCENDKEKEQLELEENEKPTKEFPEQKSESVRKMKNRHKNQSEQNYESDNVFQNKKFESSSLLHQEHQTNRTVKTSEIENVNEHEVKECIELKRELNMLNTHFEAFIVEVTEREIAYEEVYKEIHNELNEQRIRCDALQRQVSELSTENTILLRKTDKSEILRGQENVQRENQKERREHSFSDSHGSQSHRNLSMKGTLPHTSSLSKTLLSSKAEEYQKEKEEEEEEEQLQLKNNEVFHCHNANIPSSAISKHPRSASQISERQTSKSQNGNNRNFSNTSFTDDDDDDDNVKPQVVLESINKDFQQRISSEERHPSYLAPSGAHISFSTSGEQIIQADSTALPHKANIPLMREHIEINSAEDSRVVIPSAKVTQVPSQLHIPKGAAALRDMYMTNECKLAPTQRQHRSRKQQRGLTESCHSFHKQSCKSKPVHDSNVMSTQIIIPKVQNISSAEDVEKNGQGIIKRKRVRRTSLTTLSSSASSCSSESSLFTRFSRHNCSEITSTNTSAVHVAPSLISMEESVFNANSNNEKFNNIKQTSQAEKGQKTEMLAYRQMPMNTQNFKSSDVHFGANPVADYLKLENNVSSNRERQLLQEQLLKYYSYSFTALSEGALHHIDIICNSSMRTIECLPEL